MCVCVCVLDVGFVQTQRVFPFFSALCAPPSRLLPLLGLSPPTMAVPDAPPRAGTAAPSRAVFVTRDGILPRSSSVQHWQLRDLVACPSPGGALYVVRHCSILRYSLKDGKVRGQWRAEVCTMKTHTTGLLAHSRARSSTAAVGRAQRVTDPVVGKRGSGRDVGRARGAVPQMSNAEDARACFFARC